MIFLIDLENVSSGGFLGIEELSENDTVIVFYSETATKIPMATHRKLETAKAKKEYFSIKSGGKNALDFQLSTYLGYLLAKDKKSDYCIVSNDTGYDFVIDFWKQNASINISRYENLKMETAEHLEKKILSLLPEHNNDVKSICNIIRQYKTKQGVNNALVKKYGSENAGIIYKAVKSLLKDKK